MTMTTNDLEARKILQAARVIALRARPYLAQALCAIQLREKAGIGTMACDAAWRVYYDPATVRQWGVQNTAAGVLHEIGHLVRGHHARAKALGVTADTAREANIAQDCAINEHLICAGDTFALLATDSTPAKLGLPAGKTWEEYYQILRSKAEQQQQGGGQGQPQQGKGQQGQPQQGAGCKCGSGATGVRESWEDAPPSDGGSDSGEAGEGDVPGLNEGASEGRGLGHDFLRHDERCAAIVHVIDTATIEPGRNPVDDLDVIEQELSRYGGLEDRPRLVALNKVDVPDGRDIADITEEDLRARGLRVIQVSAASGVGLKELTFAMAEIVAASRTAKEVVAPQRIVLRPAGADGSADFTVTETDEVPSEPGHRGWRVRGTKPERWVRQTDFSNDEAVGFLADRLNRLGVEERLVKLGAIEGDTVLIGRDENSVVFDFKPGIEAGAEMLGRRGEDQRFDERRDASRRRRDIDSAMPERGENETRADVARRLDAERRGGSSGPMSYEIGSADDPDWAEQDPGAGADRG